MIKTCYLIMTAFELLQGDTLFSKLGLRNPYHLARIKEGDEWKTAFNMLRGHYECQVMPNGRAILQALVNNMLRDMLDRHVFVYFDKILIFSRGIHASRSASFTFPQSHSWDLSFPRAASRLTSLRLLPSPPAQSQTPQRTCLLGFANLPIGG